MFTTATHFVRPDWWRSEEGKNVFKSLIDKHESKRKVYGLLEQPMFSLPFIPDEFTYKIFVSGKSFVGKTCSVANLTGNPIPSSHSETPGIQTSTTYWPAWMTDVEKLVLFKLQFFDAGENALKKFDHILPACKDKADAVMFLFSFTDKPSFEDVPAQMSRILTSHDNVCRFVVGTKLDQQTSGQITQRDIQDFECNWKLPILVLKNICASSSDHSTELADVPRIVTVMNYICDQLWLRDQILSGRIQAAHTIDNANSRC